MGLPKNHLTSLSSDAWTVAGQKKSGKQVHASWDCANDPATFLLDRTSSIGIGKIHCCECLPYHWGNAKPHRTLLHSGVIMSQFTPDDTSAKELLRSESINAKLTFAFEEKFVANGINIVIPTTIKADIMQPVILAPHIFDFRLFYKCYLTESLSLKEKHSFEELLRQCIHQVLHSECILTGPVHHVTYSDDRSDDTWTFGNHHAK